MKSNKILSMQSVSKDYLLEWLNEAIQKYKGCETCKFMGLSRTELAPTGHNWSAQSLKIGEASPLDYGSAFQNVVEEARKRFNLAE